MLLSDVPLCCCCLSLQVVSYHACVCALFSFLHVIHCVSVLSMPSECCVCVCRVWLNLVFSLPIVFYSLPHGPPPWQTEVHTAILKKQCLTINNTFLFTPVYIICTCTLALVVCTNSGICPCYAVMWPQGFAKLHVHMHHF